MATTLTNGTPKTNGVKPMVNGHSRSGSVYAARHNIPSHFIGGNALRNASPSKVKDFIAENDGHSVITSVNTSFRRVTCGVLLTLERS